MYVSETIEIIKQIGKILIWLGGFTSVFLIIFYYLKFRYKERSFLIEKNIGIDEMLKKRKSPIYKVSLTLIGIAIGSSIFVFLKLPFLILITGSLFFGAIGLIIGHALDKRK